MANIKEWFVKSVLIRAGELDQLRARVTQLEEIIRVNNCHFCYSGLNGSSFERDGARQCVGCGIYCCYECVGVQSMIFLDESDFCRKCKNITCSLCDGHTLYVLIVTFTKKEKYTAENATKSWSYMNDICVEIVSEGSELDLLAAMLEEN